jgi:hypothetical protein
MRKLTGVMVLALALLCTGCESQRTLPGEERGLRCVGIDDDALRAPGVRYEVLTRNVIVGIIFVEMIIPPAIVVLDELYCPVARIPITR